jgi:hypothetical protein
MLIQITIENFAANMFRIKNACSTFGAINSPETWSASLTRFEFQGESVTDKVTSFLTEEYGKQLGKVQKRLRK